METPTLNLIEKQEHIELAARALKGIAHPLRLKILCVIGDREVCVQEIVDQVGTSQSNISQHLAILREKNVLMTRKDANRVIVTINGGGDSDGAGGGINQISITAGGTVRREIDSHRFGESFDGPLGGAIDGADRGADVPHLR